MSTKKPVWLLIAALALTGCSTTARPLPERYCDTCIGPYDLLLSSHREGLGL